MMTWDKLRSFVTKLDFYVTNLKSCVPYFE
jgi:hypothetical protein